MKRITGYVLISMAAIAIAGCSSDSGDEADAQSSTTGTSASDGTDGTDGTSTSDGTDGTDGSASCAAGFADGAGNSCDLGSPMADFTIKNCSGDDVTFSEQLCQSKCTLVYFGAGWCVPCRDKQPKLVSWHDKYSAQGFQIIDVLRENSGPSDLATTTFCQEWTEEYDLPFPVLIDPTDRITATCLGSQAFPVSMLVRSNWDVVHADFGGTTSDSEWEELIQECISL